jgi:predicted transcriptional regulator
VGVPNIVCANVTTALVEYTIEICVIGVIKAWVILDTFFECEEDCQC